MSSNHNLYGLNLTVCCSCSMIVTTDQPSTTVKNQCPSFPWFRIIQIVGSHLLYHHCFNDRQMLYMLNERSDLHFQRKQDRLKVR